jgi:hypothetical protein
MKKLGMILLASLAVIQAEALLPPLYQTAAEIRSIVSSEQLGQKLQSGEVIEKIEKNDQGYEITTNQHQIQVEVEYEPAQRPGPAHFRLHFGEPHPLSSQ